MMEFWTAFAAIAASLQVLVLIVTACFVWKYLQETAELRRAAQRQVVLANDQLEAQIRPALTLVNIEVLYVSNVGSGVGLNLRLVKSKEESVDWQAESNFGPMAKGLAAAVGGPVNTRMTVGSIGTMKGERLHLIYESLSGKTYASVVSFNEGSGVPSGVSFLTKG